MSKKRVYELAKELNTTSKRLMEKLAEINISVKNHMSLMEENQLSALFKHIGVKHKGEDKPLLEEKVVETPKHVKKELTEEEKKQKSAPRIIRKTEIIINSQSEKVTPKDTTSHPDNKRYDSKQQKRNTYIKTDTSKSGLMPGFIRGGTHRGPNKPDVIKTDSDKSVQTTHSTSTNTDSVDPKGMKSNAKEPISHELRNEQNSNHREMETKKTFPSVSREERTDKLLSTESKSFQKSESYMKSPEKTYKNPGFSGDRKSFSSNNKQDSIQKNRTNEGYSQNRTTRDSFNRQEGHKSYPSQRSSYGSNNRQEGQGSGRSTSYPRSNYPSDARKPSGQTSMNNGKPGEQRGYQNRGQEQRGQKPGGFKSKLEIPKAELSSKQEEAPSNRMEMKRVTAFKDHEKEAKKELRKEKTSTVVKNDRFVNKKTIVGEKKGVSEVLSEEFILNEFYSDDKFKKKNKHKKHNRYTTGAQQAEIKMQAKAVLTSITIGETITVKELAETLKKTATEVIKKLMGLGVMATLNQELEFDTAAIIAEEFKIKAEKAVVVTAEEILFDDSADKEDELQPRPPVVVVMGHVDHGKTSLLDSIRSENVIDSEAGGITQHIGAYTVKINKRNITFLDTPGHEAFTAMRARGAQVTDIAILVVAADDGVMPQTVEAINHAKAANVSIIVAINKMDKPGANIDRVKQELTEHGLVAEEWGGDTICVPVSAKKRENIDQLLEMVVLTADIMELKSNPNRQAKGTVIEAKLDRDRGSIATILVQRGTLNVGDTIVTGTTVGRIRAMTDDKGHKIKKAGPSIPVEILGLPEVPEAGEEFYAITDEKLAKQLAEKRRLKVREQHLNAKSRVTLDDLFVQIKEGKVKDLNILVKADVQGSVEAIKKSLEKLTNQEVRVKIIHGAVGAITESDVTLAQVSNAIIIGFNVRPPAKVTELAKDVGVDIRLYRVIYSAIEDIEAAMKGMLEPTFKEVILGHIEIRQIFKASGVGTIGGGYVTDGKVVRNAEVRVVRDGVVVHEGKLASLKRFKDDAKEVAQGYECGVLVEKYNDIKEGDIIESFLMEEVAR